MSEGVKFSDRGDRPTNFEVGLLKVCDNDGHWAMVARRLILELGPELGAVALVAVFDELAGEKVHVPSRRRFFAALWSEGRRDWIIDRVVENWSHAEIAAVLGIDESRVSQLVTCAKRTKLKRPA